MSREDDLDLDQDLERLGRLLSGGGRKPFLERPIVTPEDRWFPDRWTPDLESARVVAARLMAYAGLPELGVECEPLYEPRTFTGSDATSIAALRPEAAAAFRDISNGTAFFMIEPRELGRPQRVTEALTREVARAWRSLHDMLVDDRSEAERLTDLTTIVLGFGIIAANAAYEFSEERGQGRGAPTKLYPAPAGRLEPDRVSALLAIQCLLREEDPDRLRRFLDREKRAVFDEAYRDTDPEPVRERLGLTAEEWEPAPEGPPDVEIRPGRAGPRSVCEHARTAWRPSWAKRVDS